VADLKKRKRRGSSIVIIVRPFHLGFSVHQSAMPRVCQYVVSAMCPPCSFAKIGGES